MQAARSIAAHATRADKTAGRREAIIDAALDEFIEKGFAAARMEDIARRAGVAKGTIYLHFTDKETLFEAIVKRELVPLLTAVTSGIAPGGSVRESLENSLLPMLRNLVQTRRGAVIRLLIAEGGRFPKLAEVYYHTVIEPGLLAFGKLARRAVQTGEIEDHGLSRFPQLLIAPLILSILWSGLFERFHHLDIEQMVRVHFDQLFGTSRATPMKRPQVLSKKKPKPEKPRRRK